MLPVSSINNLFISPRCGNDTWHTTTRTGIPPSRKLFWHLGLGALWPSEVKSQVQANPARGLSCQPHASSVPKGEKAAMAGCTLQGGHEHLQQGLLGLLELGLAAGEFLLLL